jgi:transcriptional regulator with XRE-family HTH domain
MTTKSSPVLTGPTRLTGPARLRAARQARGWSLRDVSAPADIDPAHLSRVERGEKSLSVDALYRLAKVPELRELAKQLAPYVTPETPPRSNVGQPSKRPEGPVA